MFNLTKLSIYYLHIKAVRYLDVNTFLCNRIKFDVFFCNHIVNMFQERYCFLLFRNETVLMLLLKKNFFLKQLFSYIFVRLKCTITTTMISKGIHIHVIMDTLNKELYFGNISALRFFKHLLLQFSHWPAEVIRQTRIHTPYIGDLCSVLFVYFILFYLQCILKLRWKKFFIR